MSAEQKEPIIGQSTDYILVSLVQAADTRGLSLGLTLNVKGTIISGQLISGKEYHEKLGASLKGIGNVVGDELGDAIQNAGSKIYDSELSGRFDPTFIHLNNAKFYSPGQKPIPTQGGTLWRGFISTIDGFVFGSIEG